jgi:hypothetical protein
MVRVTKGQVKFRGEYYGVSKSISGLSKAEEARLISLEVAEEVKDESQETLDNKNKRTKSADKSGNGKTKPPKSEENQGNSDNQGDSENREGTEDQDNSGDGSDSGNSESQDDPDSKENSEDAETCGPPESINIEFNPNDVIVGKE